MPAKAADRRVTGGRGKAGRGARRRASEQGAEAEEVARPPYGQVTEEYQREKAKELVQFFREQRLQELSRDSQVFGWTPVNEIGNGRWVMFGLLVGLLVRSRRLQPLSPCPFSVSRASSSSVRRPSTPPPSTWLIRSSSPSLCASARLRSSARLRARGLMRAHAPLLSTTVSAASAAGVLHRRLERVELAIRARGVLEPQPHRCLPLLLSGGFEANRRGRGAAAHVRVSIQPNE
jgi:hypothetical protein